MRAPVLLVEVEVGAPLPEVTSQRADGTPYAMAHVLVRDGGVPIGCRVVPLVDGRVDADLLEGLWHAGPARERLLPPDPAPFITVVIPSAMARPDLLLRCVERISRCAYPSFEIVVVDNRPQPGPERARVHAELGTWARVVTEAVPGASAARNRGIAAARGEIVAFTDDDIDVDPGWLTAIAHRFAADAATSAVTGWVFPAELETAAQVWFENSGNTIGADFAVVGFQTDGTDHFTAIAHREQPQAHRGLARTHRGPAGAHRDDETGGAEAQERVPVFRGVFGGSGNLAVRIDVLAAVGGFHPALGAGTIAHGGEDIEFLSRLLRLGHRVTMDPAVAVFHHHRADETGLRRQMFGYGTGYTAALTAMITEDVRNVRGLMRLLTAARRVTAERGQSREAAGYPATLAWAQRRGLLLGPLAYLRSRLALLRHRSRRAHTPHATPRAPEPARK
ncbi:MAG: glycosyltransferase [Hamadaea sp.]|nr:glycosyltransferase [Hamadaea sp.]